MFTEVTKVAALIYDLLNSSGASDSCLSDIIALMEDMSLKLVLFLKRNPSSTSQICSFVVNFLKCATRGTLDDIIGEPLATNKKAIIESLLGNQVLKELVNGKTQKGLVEHYEKAIVKDYMECDFFRLLAFSKVFEHILIKAERIYCEIIEAWNASSSTTHVRILEKHKRLGFKGGDLNVLLSRHATLESLEGVLKDIQKHEDMHKAVTILQARIRSDFARNSLTNKIGVNHMIDEVVNSLFESATTPKAVAKAAPTEVVNETATTSKAASKANGFRMQCHPVLVPVQLWVLSSNGIWFLVQ